MRRCLPFSVLRIEVVARPVKASSVPAASDSGPMTETVPFSIRVLSAALR